MVNFKLLLAIELSQEVPQTAIHFSLQNWSSASKSTLIIQ